ncbi:MAG: hypothetical protein ACPG5P_00320 [Saprospiraceae bacterium]
MITRFFKQQAILMSILFALALCSFTHPGGGGSVVVEGDSLTAAVPEGRTVVAIAARSATHSTSLPACFKQHCSVSVAHLPKGIYTIKVQRDDNHSFEVKVEIK